MPAPHYQTDPPPEGKRCAVLWLKRDLRLADHPALHAALKYLGGKGELLVLYLYEPEFTEAFDYDARHLAFINESLAELDTELRARGNRLITQHESAIPTLQKLREKGACTALFSHQENGHQETYQRDLRVQAWCQTEGISWTEVSQNGVIRRLENRDGWAARWEKRMRRPLLPVPDLLPPSPPQIRSAGKKEARDLGLRSAPATIQRGGRRAGLDSLESFLTARGEHYTRAMSSPVTAFTACSRISAHLSWGTLSIREAYQAAVARKAELKAQPPSQTKLWRSALRSFSSRLRWHCHFMQKLEDAPNLHRRPFSAAYVGLREKDWNEEYFSAWKDGQTGYPLIDACMRALHETGYLNFRMRAMVMSFASYHLWLHWERTGAYLATQFTDYEPGIHWSQVQMQSGVTGINQIRVYSPVKQTTEQDPEGLFIKRWVPELAAVPTTYLASPWEMPAMEQLFCGFQLGRDYPRPLVEHHSAYRAAHARLHALRSTLQARQEASEVQRKHGSRRSGMTR